MQGDNLTMFPVNSSQLDHAFLLAEAQKGQTIEWARPSSQSSQSRVFIYTQ